MRNHRVEIYLLFLDTLNHKIRNIPLVRTFVFIICQTIYKHQGNGFQCQIVIFLQKHLLPYHLH